WFSGSIDEVRVYNRPLSQAEIQTDMTTPVEPCPPPVLVGDARIEPDVNPTSAGIAEAYPSTAAATGTLTRLSVFVDQSSTATALVAGPYTSSGGHPATLLTQETLDAPAGGAWNTITVPAVPVTAGTTYWIAILGPSGALAFRDRCCTGPGSG